MSSRSVWILLVFVLLLGGLVFWQQRREQSHVFDVDRPLFADVQPERVVSVRIDQLERGLQLSMERDAVGAWQIVDPLDFPAEAGVLERLLEVISKNRAIPVEQPDLSRLSLAPPRAVLEIVETLPTGPRRLRLELGAKDLDGKYVYARVDGKVVRTLLNLDSTLERDLAGWRRHRVLNIDPASVVEVRRSGKLVLNRALGLSDLGLAAGSTQTGWRATQPWNAALDAGMVGALLTNTCYMQARTFLADSAAQLPAFGFENTDLRLEFVCVDGSEQTLLFKHDPGTESWTCMREGSTHVFQVESTSLAFLALPSDNFIDTRLAHAARDDVQKIELRRGGRSLSLRRKGQAWMLGSQEHAVSRREVFADSQAVLDLLGAIENARAARFLVGEGDSGFEPDEPTRSLFVFTSVGEFGVEFGAAHEASPGLSGRLFRRTGDDVVGVVEERIAALASREWAELVDRQMIKLPELGIVAIELEHGEFKRKYARDANSGRWSPAGADVEAPKSFQKCVDRLLSLRADVAVDLDAAFEFQAPWQVVVIDGGDVHTAYRMGFLASDPTQQGFDDGRVRGIVTSSALLQDLALIP